MHGRSSILRPGFWALALSLLLAASVPAEAQPPEAAPPEEAKAAGFFSYAVKFVCGFNPTNVGIVLVPPPPYRAGEATVKLANYATDVNIFNPRDPGTVPTNIRKKIILVEREGNPGGREPAFQTPIAFDFIQLPGCAATMDDCNRIAELIFPAGGVPTPLPLLIGFLVLQADAEIDVTAVYTAELCSDWVLPPPATEPMCINPSGDFGVGLSIDVEQIEGRYVY